MQEVMGGVQMSTEGRGDTVMILQHTIYHIHDILMYIGMRKYVNCTVHWYVAVCNSQIVGFLLCAI